MHLVQLSKTPHLWLDGHGVACGQPSMGPWPVVGVYVDGSPICGRCAHRVKPRPGWGRPCKRALDTVEYGAACAAIMASIEAGNGPGRQGDEDVSLAKATALINRGRAPEDRLHADTVFRQVLKRLAVKDPAAFERFQARRRRRVSA